MAKKQTVSFGIDQPELDAILDSVKAIQQDGVEMDFSKWMRDAVRQKLRNAKAADKSAAHRAKGKKR